eukprot:TRINITY_DN8165_c0_g1_i1.p1 TRINITY_DN8165_c0_g1~~TRINITY_DN8165_c0_g1_i1.p1  ORF type:complete len:108 (-),score=22.12 TRINITY_DN8165_c0_g1_i1:70-393(-)
MEITKAYETLKDKDKRKRYDMFGDNDGQRGGVNSFRPARHANMDDFFPFSGFPFGGGGGGSTFTTTRCVNGVCTTTTTTNNKKQQPQQRQRQQTQQKGEENFWSGWF